MQYEVPLVPGVGTSGELAIAADRELQRRESLRAVVLGVRRARRRAARDIAQRSDGS